MTELFRKRRWLAGLIYIGIFCFLTLFAAPATWAQSAENTSVESQGINAAHASAAATMRTFLQSFPNKEKGRPDRIVPDAISCMDFSGTLALLPESNRRDMAIQLKNIIDRIRFVDYEEIASEVGDNNIYEFARTGGGSIVLERRSDGEWLFNSETVEALPQIWASVENRVMVEGVTSVPFSTPGQWLRSKMPESLRQPMIVLEAWQWLGILFFIFLGVLADRVLVFTISASAGRILKRLGWELDIETRRASSRPFGLLAMAGVWALGVNWLQLPPTIVAVLNTAVKFIAATSFVWAAYKGIDAAVVVGMKKAEKTASKFDDLIVPFLGRIAKIFVVAFGIVFVVGNLGVDIRSLLAGLGLGGLAFALAAKDTVENLFGSLTVLIDKPFNVGDWVNIDGKVDGTVETVGLRSTRIRTFYNSLVTVPNATLIRSNVDNYGARRYRRWKSTLSLTYDTPPEKIEAFCEGIRELMRLHPYTRKDYYHIYANEFGAHSLDVMLYVFFETPDWGTELRERHRLFLDILRLAQKLGVEFAFPTQTIWLPKDLPAHANKPANEKSALNAGQNAARSIMRDTFGEKVVAPPPVSFFIPTEGDVDTYLRERKGGDGDG